MNVFLTSIMMFFATFASNIMMLTNTTQGIDLSIVNSIVEVATVILGLFEIFPLNIILTAFIIMVVIGVVRGLKSIFRH